MKTGKVIIFESAGTPLKQVCVALPPLNQGELLVKNLYTTICGSDLHTFCGLRQELTPTVLGHEIVGRIEAIAPGHPQTDYAGNPLQVGDTITWAVFAAPPQEKWLARKMPQKSAHLFKYGHAKVEGNDAFHGGLGEYCILRAHTATLKVPAEVPVPIAATINCALATVAGTIRLAEDIQQKTVLVTGLGLLGNATAAMARVAGAKKIIALDVSPQRLEQAKAFGVDATYTFHENKEEILAAMKQEQIDVVFDMSGAADAIELGLESLSIGGVAVWAGAVFKSRKIQLDAEQVIRKILTIKGLHNYNFEDMEYALRFIVAHHSTFPFASVVGKEFSLDEVQQAFEYALAHKPLRVGIRLSF